MYERKRKVNPVLVGGIIAVLFFVGLIVFGLSDVFAGKGLERLKNRLPVKVETAEKVMGQLDLTGSDLYDELPDIDRYPVQVQGTGDVDIEIFTSGEKAGSGHDGWLVDCARKFNASDATLGDGRTVSLTVRLVGSGLGADYILSGKARPDLYNPSNPMFADYAIANGAPMSLYRDRLVGNTAGILVKKDMSADYPDADSVIQAVMAGEISLGYTNPQNSATGANLLVYFLNKHSSGVSDASRADLRMFNANIPYIAYTTQQMVTSAASGSFDAIVSERQAYVNDPNLVGMYDYLPFGLRHDNPVYLVDEAVPDPARAAAVDLVLDYLSGKEAQRLATEYGFNQPEDERYESTYRTYGAEVGRALAMYKAEKDAGKDVIAVFVADCSGSMDGAGILELKASLSNSIKYINENNKIGLVSYSSDVTKELPIGTFDMKQKAYFQGAVDRLKPGGTTSTYEALVVALDMVKEARKDYPDAKAMVFLLSDGKAYGRYTLSTVEDVIAEEKVPIYTIAYTADADLDELRRVSEINEATAIAAGTDDIVYQLKSLFNSQL